MKQELINKVNQQKEKENKGWEVVEYALENKDLGALLNGLELIRVAKIKDAAFTETLFEILKKQNPSVA
jgi:hypothetical protein